MTPNDSNWIWGFHSVEACLETYPELVLELQIEASPSQKTGKVDPEIRRLASSADLAGVKLTEVPRLPKILSERRTQGVAAKLKEFPVKFFSEIEAEFSEVPEEGKSPRQWVLLDGVQDPRNFGAILRSAAAFGVSGVFIRERNQCPPNGTVAQASAGALFRIPIVVCSSFGAIFRRAEECGVRVVGLSADGQSLGQVIPNRRDNQSLLWILGGEGDGLSPGLREKCYGIGSIPMRSDMESLNASVAASIAFYATAQKFGLLV